MKIFILLAFLFTSVFSAVLVEERPTCSVGTAQKNGEPVYQSAVLLNGSPTPPDTYYGNIDSAGMVNDWYYHYYYNPPSASGYAARYRVEYICKTCDIPSDPPPTPPPSLDGVWLLISTSVCGSGGSPFTASDTSDNTLSLNYTVSCCSNTDFYRLCAKNESLDSLGSCVAVCDENQTYNPSNETCIDDVSPPICPPTYSDTDLPLFATVSSPSECNAFPLSDSAISEYPNGLVCCYGQEGIVDENECPVNSINIGGICHPISSSSDGNDTAEPTPNDDGNLDVDGDGVIDETETELDNLSGYAEGLVKDALGISKIQSKISSLMDSYVLLPLPFNASDSCSQEFVKSFVILGRTYVIDLSSEMQTVFNSLTIVKSIILFMATITGILITLSSGRNS